MPALLLGAGVGLFLTYATFMKRTHGSVRLGITTPLFNNVVRYQSCEGCASTID